MARNSKTIVKLAAVVLTFALCLFAETAKAESDNDGFLNFGPGETVAALAGIAALTYVAGGGFVVAIGNLYYGIKGERASSGWRIQGWVLGGINIALGAVALGFGISGDYELGKLLGPGLLVIGGMNIGFTLWSSSHPERKERLTVNPIIMQDIQGNPAVGIGLNLVNW